jgi:5-methylcytosine-specific restriction endonuclease McrA
MTAVSPLADKATRLSYNKRLREKGVQAQACGACHVVKGHDAFALKSGSASGRQAKCKACMAQQYVENREAILGRQAQQYAENREVFLGRQARYRAANPDKIRAKSQRRRARKRNAITDGHTWRELMNYWAENDMYACVYCDRPWDAVEHVAPLARGGAHALWNLVPACSDCNARKAARDPFEFLVNSVVAGTPLADQLAPYVGTFE